MDDPLEQLEKSLEPAPGKKRNFDSPPLHLWDPPLSGDIAIRIAADGSWYHEGDKITRESLVRLFASILRREADDQYYLVTPAEKWRIEVELHPLVVIDIGPAAQGSEPTLEATLNTGRRVLVNEQCPLSLESAVGDIAVLGLPHGLSALFSRAAWYRLVELAEDSEQGPVVKSAGQVFSLTPGADGAG